MTGKKQNNFKTKQKPKKKNKEKKFRELKSDLLKSKPKSGHTSYNPPTDYQRTVGIRGTLRNGKYSK